VSFASSGSVPVELRTVAVIGATGALGSELLQVLEERSFPLSRLVPVATERSLGQEVELGGQSWAVESGDVDLAGVDLVFLCAPPEVSLEYARRALLARVPCIDGSGALLEQPDVAVRVGDRLGAEDRIEQPLVASPTGPALAWAAVLGPLAEAAGLERVVGTALEAASGAAGRAGVDALSGQSIALFTQQEPSDPEQDPVAFACLPAIDAPDAEGATPFERVLAASLERLLGRSLPLAVTAVRVPAFHGSGAALALETQRPLAPDAARAALEKAPGVEIWPDPAGPSTRAALGLDAVLVGRLRRDPSREGGLQLWLAFDGVRLAAANAVKLAEALPLRPPREGGRAGGRS